MYLCVNCKRTSDGSFCKCCGASTRQIPQVTSKATEERSRENPQRNLSCKVCEQGVLVHKEIFRMSGPVVAIGYILLIPPLIGMVVSALMLFGVITYKSNESTPTGMTAQYSHGGYDDEFRHACGTAFAQSFQKSTGTTAPPILIAEYCECALSSFKGTNSETDAAQICKQQYLNGSLIVPDQEVQDIYSKPVQNVDRQQAEPSGNLLSSEAALQSFWEFRLLLADCLAGCSS